MVGDNTFQSDLGSNFVSGVSVNFKVTSEVYKPADGYSCTLRVAGSSIEKTATAQGDSFIFSFSPSENTVPTGLQFIQFFATKDSDKFYLAERRIQVLPLATDAPFDSRSKAEQIVAAIDDIMAGKITDDAAQLTVGNRSLMTYRPKELTDLRDYYAGIVAAEKRRASGRSAWKTTDLTLRDA